jgi:hypothetical protein
VTEPGAVVRITPPAAPPAVPGQMGDAVGDLQQAWRVVEQLGATHDIAATLQTAVVCTGNSQLEALEAVVALVRQSPRAELHNIAWARTPGPTEDTSQYQATVTLSYPDRYGETTGTTHHAERPRGGA